MAEPIEDEDTAGAPHTGAPAAKGKHKPDRKQMIIVVASVAGVILAYLTFRSKSSSTAATDTTSSLPLSESGTNGQVLGAGGTVDQSDIDQGFQQLIAGQAALMSQLAGTAPAAGTQTSSPTTFTSAQFFNPGQNGNGGALSDTIGFIRNTVTGAIYEVEPTPSGGSVYYHLQPYQYASLGSPKTTPYTAGSKAVLPTTGK